MIKKLLVLFFLFFNSLLFAQVDIIVSILPQQSLVKEIGGDKVNISVMVKPGSSPHTYEPKPSQMRDISNADIYFSIDVEFEHNWLPKFINQNKNMLVANISKNIKKLHIDTHHHHNEESLDPHIWTSPNNLKTIAKNIYINLVKIDKRNKDYYETNYKKLLNKIVHTDKTIQNILKDTPLGTKFMVFHPAWGYFAKQYKLEQFSIEISGKSPKPKELIYILKKAKQENIKAIFTSPEFSLKASKLIAKELNIKVIKISPLNPKWSNNLINLANAITNNKKD